MTIGAVIFESGVVFRSGNTCSVSDRKMSLAYAGVTESFFSSNQAVATFSNVCSVSARLASFCAAVHLGINALCKQLARFHHVFPGVRWRELWVRAQPHVDTIFGCRLAVVEVSPHRAIAPDSELRAIIIAEDVILVFCLDCLEPAVGKAKGWSSHEICL